MDSASSPPSYARSTAPPCPPVLLNLAPLADGTSFQVGGLLGPDPHSPGAAPAAVAGEVQIKFTEGETALLEDASQQQQTPPPPKYGRLTVAFKGVETDARGHQITLVEQSRTLWEHAANGAAPPTVSRFRFDLTSDLPTCIHLASSSLAYTLTATLYPLANTIPAAATEPPDDDALPLSRCVPVHLVRTATPAALVPVQSATVTASDPIRWSVRFPRTVYTRREPIGLVVRVEVPDSKRIGEGLRLRTISAELVRTITATAVASSSQSRSVTTLEVGGEADVQRRTVLAHSGKSARFSPSRPIIIRLVLHPPLEPTCESISQSTIAHHVSFAVVVTVGLVNTASTSTSSSTNLTAAGTSTSVTGPASTSHSGPAAHDSVLTQELTILPDLPPTAAALPRSEKQKEVERDAVAAGESSIPATTGTSAASSLWEEEHPDAPVPSYVEDLLLDPGTIATTAGASPPPPPPMASTSAGWTTGVESPKVPALRRQDSSSLPLFTPTLPPSGYTLSASLEGYDDQDDEEEYDGYEELSLPASLSERPPPPRIDDDISPPSMAEPSSAFGYRLAADSGEVIIIGDEEDERNREAGEEGSALSMAASRDGRMMSGGASMQELLPPHRRSATTADEPETPPPPVDYDLPFLSTPARLPPLPPSSLPSTPPPPPSPPPLAAAFAAYPGAPPNDCEPGPIPSSPPPPLSPLDPNHHLVALPPFSSTSAPPSSVRAADHSHNDHASRSLPPPTPGSASPEGLPPPYAGRLQSPSPPPATAVPAPSSPSSTTSSLPPTARVAVPILDAAPPPRRHGPHHAAQAPPALAPHAAAPEPAGHRYSSPRPAPPPPPSSSSSSGTFPAPARVNVASMSSQQEQQQPGESLSPVGGVEDGTPPTEDESRPPPYEQRDDFAASVGGGGPSGIQWGMMHTTTNRRGELVL